MPATSSTTVDADGSARVAFRSAAGLLWPAVVFLGLTLLRTHGISRTFWLLGDQILYWRIALGSWRDLPIGGGPSSVGGTTLGPVFCWTLWAIRHLVGPWCDNLPHAGGIGLSICQSAADALLFAALWRYTSSLALALAFTLFVATAPFDLALSATIWNPPLAVAFVKTSLAVVLLGGRDPSAKWDAAAAAPALLAVQAHSSAVFFAAPLISSLVARPLVARRWREAGRRVVVIATVVLVLEAPFLADLVAHSGHSTSPAVVVSSVSYILSHPAALRPMASFGAVVAACARILFQPATLPWAGALFVACLILAGIRVRHDLTIVMAAVAPPCCAVIGFAFWRLPYDDYWFMCIVPCVALSAALAFTLSRAAVSAGALVLLTAATLATPARIATANRLFHLPEYEPLVAGSRLIRRRAPQIRSLDTVFALPPSTDPLFVYEILGGRIADGASFTATIRADGSVKFEEATAGSSGGDHH
ncbi:MAG TPA: hypothetical protein VHU82_02700 [Vicinamibacterales bacterium]|nr:hypothetical protein [Vicinamibacterales bacterium]